MGLSEYELFTILWVDDIKTIKKNLHISMKEEEEEEEEEY